MFWEESSAMKRLLETGSSALRITRYQSFAKSCPSSTRMAWKPAARAGPEGHAGGASPAAPGGGVGLQGQARDLLPVFMPRLAALGRGRHCDFGQTKLPRTPGVKREDLKPVVSAERPGQVLGQDAIEAQHENAPIRMQLPEVGGWGGA